MENEKQKFTLLTQLKEKIKEEEKEFKTELLKKEKETIIFSFVELYIYNRLRLFIDFLKNELIYNNRSYFSIEELERFLTLQDIGLLIERQYYTEEIYEDKLTNNDLITYFKKI